MFKREQDLYHKNKQTNKLKDKQDSCSRKNTFAEQANFCLPLLWIQGYSKHDNFPQMIPVYTIQLLHVLSSIFYYMSPFSLENNVLQTSIT